MERRSRIGRLGGFGREGRRRCSRSAAARGRGAAGVRPSGAPGVNPTRAWVGWHPRGMRKPLEAKAWLGRAWAGLATARGGRRGGASPACGVPGAKAVYGPSYLAKATREALGAHRGCGAVEVAAAGRRRRGSRAALGRSSGPGRWRAPLGVQAPQVEPWRCCEAGLRVRAARGLKTVSKSDGGRLPAALLRVDSGASGRC